MDHRPLDFATKVQAFLKFIEECPVFKGDTLEEKIDNICDVDVEDSSSSEVASDFEEIWSLDNSIVDSFSDYEFVDSPSPTPGPKDDNIPGLSPPVSDFEKINLDSEYEDVKVKPEQESEWESESDSESGSKSASELESDLDPESESKSESESESETQCNYFSEKKIKLSPRKFAQLRITRSPKQEQIFPPPEETNFNTYSANVHYQPSQHAVSTPQVDEFQFGQVELPKSPPRPRVNKAIRARHFRPYRNVSYGWEQRQRQLLLSDEERERAIFED